MEQSNPFRTVQEMLGGYVLARCLNIVVELGVADVLDETPRTAAALGVDTNSNPDALGRVLRLLSGHGVFEAHGELFSHSPASRLLRGDHPHSLRTFVLSFGSSLNWTIYAELEHTVRTGRPAMEKVLPGGLWAYRQEHPQEASLFNEAMEAKARRRIAGVLEAYSFAGFDRIADIGGGCGELLQAVLEATPGAKGVLFDLPYAIEEAANAASDRLTLQAGDFFRDALPVCDAYLLMDIIHDWGDEEAIAILAAIRRAAPAHAKLLLIELPVPADPGPDWALTLDVHMLTLFGGRQRTVPEYKALFARAGFAFQREIAAGAGLAILESVPA